MSFRPSPIAAALCAAAIAVLTPSSALAAATPEPAAPAPAAGSCVHPVRAEDDHVVYRYASRSNSWRVRPLLVGVPTKASPTAAANNGTLAQLTAHTKITAWYFVLDARQVDAVCWFRVRLPALPNNRSAWVRRDQLVVERTTWQIEVDLSDRRVYAYQKGKLRVNARVVVGKRSTPTPTSTIGSPFAMYDAKQGSPNAFTGTWQLATTAYSPNDQTLGRIGLHGRGGESLQDPLGTAASNGCVRIANSSVNLLVRLIGLQRLLGTPVIIRA